MASKEGLLSSLKSKIWAGLLSAVAAISGSSTLYFWNTITGQGQNEKPRSPQWTGQRPGGNRGEPQQPLKAASVLKASFQGLKPAEQRGTFCPMLGCLVEEERGSLRIVDVPQASQAARFGLAPGDVIESINARAVQSMGDIFAAVKAAGPFRASEVIIRRGDQRLEGDFRFRSEELPTIRTQLRPFRQ